VVPSFLHFIAEAGDVNLKIGESFTGYRTGLYRIVAMSPVPGDENRGSMAVRRRRLARQPGCPSWLNKKGAGDVHCHQYSLAYRYTLHLHPVGFKTCQVPDATLQVTHF